MFFLHKLKIQMVSHLKIIIVILIVAAFSGCSEYKEKPVAVELKSSKKIIAFNLDDNTSNISDGLFYYSNPNFLFSLNWLENSIQIFDVGSKKRIKNLKFDYEGPNGVLDIFGIHVQNLDSRDSSLNCV